MFDKKEYMREYGKNYRLKHNERINKYSKDYRSSHKEKVSNNNKEYYIVHTETERKRSRRNWLKKAYQITPEEYDILFKEQSGCCAICKKEQPSKNLSVDHNHKTGDIRGLLCTNCNAGLGLFLDSPTLLKGALQYLETKRIGG